VSTDVEFGTKAVADSYREEYEEYLCSDDDARLKTVTFASDVPDDVLRQAQLEADESRAEREVGPGQAPLSDGEMERIDFDKPRANVPHARSVKALAAEMGVDDWTSYYDGMLTVDEHRDIMQKAAQEGGGRRMDSEDSVTEKAGRAAKTARAEGCDHARDHCEHGDPDACDFLKQQCGMSDEDVAEILDESDGDELTGKERGALKRAWGGYKGAIADLSKAMVTVRQEWEHAQQAAKAINSIRTENGQNPEHFDRLEELQAEFADFLRMVRSDCEECHADHSGHDHAVTSGDREDMRELATEGAPATPVGVAEQGDGR
jgi:hypothetical protein